LGLQAVYLDLERPSDLAKLTEPELYLEAHADALVVLDEIQRVPDLFPVLRSLVDAARRPGRFLLLGSASPDLWRQGSETLAGRIRFLELTPFQLSEVVGESAQDGRILKKLWLRGGYPDSFLAANEGASSQWRAAFIATFLERDVPQLGFRVSAVQMRRFWEMLAHLHGQLWNASAFARNFAVTAPPTRHHLDLLTDALLVRQLQPFHVNLKKRLVKAPKIYIRDTGLLHELLRIADFEGLQGHPVLGASFEGSARCAILAPPKGMSSPRARVDSLSLLR
jgi:predicted AAA+ superfamily ATPase